jgi:hypothetical protein
MSKSKLSALLSLILVFASGAVLGAFAYRLYSATPVLTNGNAGGAQSRPNPAEFRKRYAADLTKGIKLDPEQIKRLNVILDQTTEEFDKLNDKSKPEWDALNEKRDALREKYRPDREAIHNVQVERINAMLREDQRALYTAWRAERDAERERQRKLRDQQHQKQ